MAHVPYGYDIIDGKAVINAGEAANLKTIFELYIGGAALQEAGKKVGLTVRHSSIGRMLRKELYTGTDFYPAIIDKETFNKAEEERLRRAKAMNRIYDYSNITKEERQRQKYHLAKVERRFEDPFEQAAYAYSQIESEEING